jgi:hypothetical protein
MHDLLNDNERRAAEAMGWVVAWVYCMTKNRVLVQVLPAPGNPIKSAAALQQVVTLRAQAGEALAVRVMSLVLNPPPPRKKAK